VPLLDRLWLGGALDLGLAIGGSASDETRVGLQLFPRVQLDLLASQVGRVRVGDFMALGVVLTQYLGASGSQGWTATAQLLLGLSLGG
jgi:hypothetical protein